MSLVSVDPGEHAGWALWELRASGWALRRVGRVTDPEIGTCWDILKELRCSNLLVEGQWYVPPRRHGDGTIEYRGGNFSSVLALIERRQVKLIAPSIK